MKEIKEILGDYLYYFGYTNHPEIENPHAFFNFEEHEQHNLEQFNGYKKLNEEHLKWVINDSDKMKDIQYIIDDPSKLLNISFPDNSELLDKLIMKENK